MLRILCCTLLGAAACAARLAAQQPPHPTPAELGRRIDAYVAPLIVLDVFSGVVLVARGDSVLVERAYGMANHEHQVAMAPSAAFRIASISKSYTRALVGRLADRGRIGLDDPIQAQLPDFPSAGRITIRMLLDHRAGVPSVNSLPYDEEALAPHTLAALVDSIRRLPLDFAPGTSRQYSNGGYAVLARIVELVEGRPFDQVLRTELLAPLGLARTGHEADGEIVPGLAAGYMPDPARPGTLVRAPFQEMSTKLGGGSMVSTARELHRWARAIGRSGVLRPETWRELFPRDTLVYSGRAPGYNAFLLRDRTRELTVVVLANNYAASAAGDVVDAALALAVGETPRPLAVRAPTAQAEAAALQPLAGSYAPPEGALPLPPGAAISIRQSGDHLVLHLADVPFDVLIPQGERTFLARGLWSLVEFEPPADGRSPAILVRALYRDATFRAPRQHP